MSIRDDRAITAARFLNAAMRLSDPAVIAVSGSNGRSLDYKRRTDHRLLPTGVVLASQIACHLPPGLQEEENSPSEEGRVGIRDERAESRWGERGTERWGAGGAAVTKTDGHERQATLGEISEFV